MLIKFFGNKGGGSPKASMDYLLREGKEDTQFQVLRGDPELSQSIAESCGFKNAYTVGCLSFEEENILDHHKTAIMDRFEKHVFAGLEKEQYNITWVEHTDKNRLELNFYIPNVELTSQKRLQPYYDKADRPLIENFKQVINHEYGLTDPRSPDKQQTLITGADLPTEKRSAMKEIDAGISALVQKGLIRNRDDVIEALKQSGFEIARVTPKNLSIKTEGQNLRLKGAFYEQDFKSQLADASRHLSESIQAEQTKLIRRTVSVWKLPFIILGVLVLILAGISLFLTYWSVNEYQNLTEWKRSAEIYQTQSHNIKLTNCTMDDKSKRLCVAVDPKYKTESWGEKNEPYQILAK